jgi:hypothetical protein
MCFAIAAGLLAQTLPVVLVAETNNKVHHLTHTHKKFIRKRILKLNEDIVQNNDY